VLKKIKSSVWKTFTFLDAKIKFPNLKSGEIGIQAGFDMDRIATTDLLTMDKREKPDGMILGIEADPRNIKRAKEYVKENQLNIELVLGGLFSEEGEVELLLGESKSSNQLTSIPIDETDYFTGELVTVPMKTLDTIVEELKIDIDKIGHISLTINGAEYFSLLGMTRILEESKNLNLTIVAGRHNESAYFDADGVADYIKIIELLEPYGFTIKFKRIHQLFWWGFVVKALLNRKWIYGQKNYGVVFAAKGNKELKWYQSFS